MTKKNGQVENKGKDPKKISIQFTKEGKKTYYALKEQYDCGHKQMMDLLLNSFYSRVDKGANHAERVICEYLYLGSKKKITAGTIRKSCELKGTPVNLKSIKDVIKLYEVEIEKHNSTLLL